MLKTKVFPSAKKTRVNQKGLGGGGSCRWASCKKTSHIMVCIPQHKKVAWNIYQMKFRRLIFKVHQITPKWPVKSACVHSACTSFWGQTCVTCLFTMSHFQIASPILGKIQHITDTITYSRSKVPMCIPQGANFVVVYNEPFMTYEPICRKVYVKVIGGLILKVYTY